MCPEICEGGILNTGSTDNQITHRQQIKTRIIRPNGYWYPQNMLFNGDQITKVEWYMQDINKCTHCVYNTMALK